MEDAEWSATVRAVKRFLVTLFVAFVSLPLFAPIFYMLKTPHDEKQVHQKVIQSDALKPLVEEYRDLVEMRFWSLQREDVDRIFNSTNQPPLDLLPGDAVLLSFIPSGLSVSGARPSGTPLPRLREVYSLGDVGYLEVYYHAYGATPASALFYARIDPQFVALNSEDDLPRRVEWERPKFAAFKSWLDLHLPKLRDLGEVKISETSPTSVDLGDGVTVTIRANPQHSLSLAKTGSDAKELEKTRRYKSVTRPNQSIAFSVDDKFYRLKPEFVR